MISRAPILTEEMSLPARLTVIEEEISRQFSRRIYQFHISIQETGLVLEGRATTYFCKQSVQEAVIVATDFPIAANNISVTSRCPVR